MEIGRQAGTPLEAAGSAFGQRLEDRALMLVLAAMALLPVVEMSARWWSLAGIEGESAIVQHLGLVVAMLGGAIAAREHRLLSASALNATLPAHLRAIATRCTMAVAAVVCALLAVSGAQFVAAERPAGKLLAYGLPVWCLQAVIPIGFAWIGWRIVASIAQRPRDQAAALALVAAFAALSIGMPMLPSPAFGAGMVAVIASALFGAPLFAVLAGAALLLFWQAGLPLAAIALDHYRMVVNPTLPAIPLFTLAGYFIAESRAPERLLLTFRAWFGAFRRGPIVVAVLASSLMTCMTGASGVTILALGGLLLPQLRRFGFAERPALGLVTAAGLPGVLLVPSLPIMLYAVVAGVDIRRMFAGAFLPALLMALLTILWAARQPASVEVAAFDIRTAWASLWAAKWELALPLVAVVPLFTGITTPVEAAALTALYAFTIETVVHRDLRLATDVPRVFAECGLLVGGILLILGVALGLTSFLVDAQVPDRVTDWLQHTVSASWVCLLALNILLLVASSVMEIFSAIVVLAPLLAPIGRAYDIDPVHLGVVVLANLEIGYLTPPVGINLLVASYRYRTPLLEVYRSVLSLVPWLICGLLAITYLPWLSLALPKLMH